MTAFAGVSRNAHWTPATARRCPEHITGPGATMREIRINGRSLEVHTMVGKVVGASKHLETKVHGSGGGGGSYQGTGYTAPVHISSTTTTHDQIFLQASDGSEHALKLQNWDLACRESHELIATWMMKKGAKSGPYVAIRNMTTGSTDYNDKALAQLTRPWYPLLGLVLPFLMHFSGLSFMLAIAGWGVWLYLGMKGRREIKGSGILFPESGATLMA